MTLRTPRVLNLFSLLLFTLGGACRTVQPQETTSPNISLASLLLELVDREANARLPKATFTCAQASSYDRASDDPEDPSTWFANWDRSHFVRSEQHHGRREYVMLDVQGPGALVRFWGTWHGAEGEDFSDGVLRVYIDGHDQPAIEGPIAQVLSGGFLVGAPLAESVSSSSPETQRGHNLYLPIPYAKHCKVTYSTAVPMAVGAQPGEALYYQINYRTYPPGTRMESYSAGQLADAGALIESVQEQLSSGPDSGGQSLPVELSGLLKAGSSREIQVPGPAAIRECRLQIAAADLDQALRSTILEIAFDGEDSIWCPLGDFFGTGYRLTAQQTWFTQVTEDGELRCFWVMPFARSARLRLTNLGSQDVDVTFAEIHTAPWTWDKRSMHFHASWRQYNALKTTTSDMSGVGGPEDRNYISIAGRGILVGDTLTLFDAAAAWWGEGDEKIYVDGEDFPSHFGTGTEDYYGYAWCRGETFASAFHAQPMGDGNQTAGLTVNSRYRALDAIPFEKSLRFDMEIWHWANTLIDYAPTTFWYCRPGGSSNVSPDHDSAMRNITRDPEQLIPAMRIPGAIEGEGLQVFGSTGGLVQIQHTPEFGWSGNRQLWWRDGNAGDELELLFPVTKAGTYHLQICLTKAQDYGVLRMFLDGNALGSELDCFGPQVSTELHSLGEHTLTSGDHRLTLRITGRNPEAIPRHMLGLDYLLLTE